MTTTKSQQHAYLRGGEAAQSAQANEAQDMELSIVMPCLNEREAIAECVREARKSIERAGVRGEVLVVDNGSVDGSPDLARAAGARVVQESRRGYGNAYLRGFREALGKYIIMADSDGTYDFSLVPEFLQRLREGHEFVNGSRLRGETSGEAIPFLHRYVGVPLLTWMLNRLSGARFSDAHCGMRAFTRDAVKRMSLASPGMEFASEMIFRAARTGLRSCELPIPYRPRKGESKLRTFSDGWRHIRFMLLWSPTHLFFIPGAAMLATGMLVLLALVWGKLQIAGQTFDMHYMVIGSLLAILGFQVAALGVYGRTLALSMGILHNDPLIRWGQRHLTLEKGLLAGALATAGGLSLLLWIVMRWVQLDFSFDATNVWRPALFGLTLVVIGAQTVFSSFFLSLLGMRIPAAASEQVAEPGTKPYPHYI